MALANVINVIVQKLRNLQAHIWLGRVVEQHWYGREDLHIDVRRIALFDANLWRPAIGLDGTEHFAILVKTSAKGEER
jgi:hypothetical protein